MFFAKSTQAAKYNFLSDKFTAAYRWLNETNIKELPVGSYSIIGEEVVANVQEYETSSKEERSFENHHKYFDIQYMVSGQEMIGVCEAQGLKLKEAHEDRDLYFYEEPDFSGEVFLREGDLLVVAPEDAHKPGCAAGKPEKVKKVVVKVAIS